MKKDVEDGTAVFVDTRDQHEVHRGTVPDSINVPAFNKPATHAGWAYDPESDSQPLVLLAADRDTAQMVWDHLIRVGIDDVAGFVTSLDGLPIVIPELVSPDALESTDYDLLLDVRKCLRDSPTAPFPGAAAQCGQSAVASGPAAGGGRHCRDVLPQRCAQFRGRQCAPRASRSRTDGTYRSGRSSS